jgi:hypothetical protein
VDDGDSQVTKKPVPPYVPKPFDVVLVVWNDACTQSALVHDSPASAVTAASPSVRKTVGYWCGRNKHGIVIADTDDRCIEAPQAVGGITFIPTGMVVDISPIGAPVKKK